MFTSLETDRLVLKNMDHSDRDFILEVFSNPDINRYLFDAEPISNLQEADEIIGFYSQQPKLHHRWILILKDSGQKIGTCGFHAWDQGAATVEMGYDLLPAFQSKGYMTEALEKIIGFAKETMGLSQIYACIYPENLASVNLIKKFNFQKIGHRIETFRNKDYDHDLYGLEI